MKLSSEHETGRAAEHLVVADLILQGVPAYLVGGALPYDVIADWGGHPYRVQVKATECARSWRKARDVYRFGLRHGKGAMRCLEKGSIDIIAFVGIDKRLIAYFAATDLLSRGSNHIRQTVDLRDESRYEGRRYSTGKVRLLTWHQRFQGHEQFRSAAGRLWQGDAEKSA